MIDKLIAFSVKNKLAIGLFVLALIGCGIYSLKKIPIDAVPDITNNQVQIITKTPNLAAQEVEQFITYPVEIAMSNLPDVEEIRSISRFGISVITVVFEEDMDIYLARQLISEQLKIAEEEIPEGFGTPELAPITSGLGEIYQYIIHTAPGYDTMYSAMELRSINDWIVKRQLAGTKGIIEVSGWGGFLKQYEVSVNPEKLRSLDLTIAEVFRALKNNNENTGGSYIENRYNTYFIRGEGLVKSIADIEKVVVKTVDNIPVLVRDIGTVQFGSAPRYGAITWNGKGEVVGGQALMLKGENSYDVVTLVKERVASIQKSLPEGVIIEPYLERSGLIDRAIGTVSKNLIEGGLIVIFILIILLGNLRGGLIVASVIPLSMLFAITMMHIFGVSANLMSLGAIDFGLIVDGAVIIVESIVHRLFLKFNNRKLTSEEMDDHVKESAIKIRSSAAFGEIIILIVYLPILALVGIEGKMFTPMAQTVSFAIFGALILSLTYVPMMCALFLKKNIVAKVTIADRIIGFLQRLYEPLITIALKRRIAILLATVALFFGSLGVFNRLGGEFIPTLEEGDFALHQILPPGSSLSQSVSVSKKIQDILLEKFPEIEHVVTKIGTAEIATDPMPIEVGDIIVKMKPKEEWRYKSKDLMFEKMAEELAIIPGVNYEFTQPIQMRFNELISGVRQDVAIKIYGEDLDVLAAKGKEAEKILKQVQGVGDVKAEQLTGLPQMLVSYNRNKIAQYGLNIKDVNTLVRSAFAGEKAGVVFEGEKRFDLVVRLEKAHRRSIEDIRMLYLPLPNGSQIPLQEVANIEFKEAPVQISRENTKRRVTVGVNARNRDIESLVAEIQTELDEKLDLPAGYFIEYGGQFENLLEAKNRLAIAVPAALLLIITLLYFTFGSFKQALLIFTAIPMSAIGGVLALWFRGMPFSISAGIGFIALFGVAVLNGIVLIAYFNQLKSEGWDDIKERIMEGTKVRLRPVIMTASVAALGFLPMALSNSAGAEVQKPLATVVIGGLITATLLTLFVLPILYSLFERKRSIKLPKAGTTLMLLILIGLPFSSFAQDTRILNLNDAVAIAMENHPSIKSSTLEVEKMEALKKTALDLGNTSFKYSIGELNGLGTDTEWSISQTIDFPTSYLVKAKLQKEQLKKADMENSLAKLNLERDVRRAYYDMAYRQSKLNLLKDQELVYAKFSEQAELKYSLGETNMLEKVSAEGKAEAIKLKRKVAESDVAFCKQVLQNLLSTDMNFDIQMKQQMKLADPTNFKLNENTPAVVYFNQTEKITTQAYKLQKTAMLPKLSVGYINKEIDGVDGFTGISVGASIPLFFRAEQGRIQGAKLESEKAKYEAETATLFLDLGLKNLKNDFRKSSEAVNYFEEKGLKISDELLQYAQLAYREGEINYVTFLATIEQAITIKDEYLESLNAYNQKVIQIHFISGTFN